MGQKTIYFYPTVIQTTTGHSISHHTQKITNPSNLCSDSKALAYWGVKNPTNVGVFMRNYYDSVTTKSGSYNKPEIIYATKWDTKNIPNNAIIKKIAIEYKWEQISYSCGTKDCYGRFDKPTITLSLNGKSLYSFKGAKPDAIRYNNNKTNEAKMNTNNANLAVLHSHNKDVSKFNLTIKDLNNLKLKFDPAENTYSEYCRIVMQFIRLKIDYEEAEAVEVLPNYRITNAKITPADPEIPCNSNEMIYHYQCTIKSTTSAVKTTTCTVRPIGNDIIINNAHTPNGNTYDKDNHVWRITKFKNYQATLDLTIRCTEPGEKKIEAKINAYGDSVQNNNTLTFKVTKIPDEFNWKIGMEGKNPPYTIDNSKENNFGSLKIDLHRTCNRQNRNESITIDTQGLITENIWQIIGGTGDIEPKGNGVWVINNILYNNSNRPHNFNITIKTYKTQFKSGEYKISVTHKENNTPPRNQYFYLYVIDKAIPMNFFKLKLEDGSDVKYNSLTISAGDDLQFPLTYNLLEDNFVDNINVDGEIKRIPTKEARYITFSIKSKIDLEDVLCKLDIKSEHIENVEGVETSVWENTDDIIVGAENNIQLFRGASNTFCIIDKITANEEKKVKFIVQSEIEQTCFFELRVLNYDDGYRTNKWTLSTIIFEDMPSIKLSIETDKDDLTTPTNDITTLQYIIENQSNVDGNNLKFQLKEPRFFKILNWDLTTEPSNLPEQPIFNENNRTLIFPILPGVDTPKKNILTIQYQGTKRGIYDFKIHTVDDINSMEDDQWENSATKTILVNISNNALIKTSVSKQRPTLNELIDFKIKIKNRTKYQQQVKFHIKDIGNYDPLHNKNDYTITYDTKTKGEFISSNNVNEIGSWIINDLNIGDKEELVLTLQPQELGTHIIETTFVDSNNQIQDFSNTVNVLTPKKQLDFNVYHAISPNKDVECDCANVIEICDDDYIDLGDDLYYVCEITNNNRNDITDPTHFYARLNNTFLKNPIICHTHEIISENNNLLHITIPYIDGCSTIKICFKVTPNKIGTYINHFMLTNRNAHVYHKQLKINVNKEFIQKNLEHEITIYNFEKTNHYFRYELDDNNDIFKFFNQGNDKSLRMINSEEYNRSKVETYKGTNLKNIIRDIADNSKYVEPELLRVGNNKFAPKGYEIYPDGFIRRFGLLNSEVFHYTGQLPVISHLADKAMKWDIDTWDTKVWGGDIYDNGVFDLTIDYGKIPTNFNILELDNPIKNLQTLVDKTKPYGTQAICYYSTKLYLDMNINASLDNFVVNHNIDLPLSLTNVGLISLYNKHDNNIDAFFDIFNLDLTSDIYAKVKTTLSETLNPITKELRPEPYNDLSLKPSMMIASEVYDQQYSKQYINNCADIISQLYAHNPNIKNIDIVKKYDYQPTLTRSALTLTRNSIYCLEYIEPSEIIMQNINNTYKIQYEENIFDNFIGFKIYENNQEKFKTNFCTPINNYNIQIQNCAYNIKQDIIHIFCSINNQPYIHIGFFYNDTKNNISIQANNYQSYSKKEEDQPIRFQIKNTVNTIDKNPDKVIQFSKTNKWENLNNIKEEKEYAFIANNIDVDRECKITTIQTPTLGLKYNKINISDNDEVVDIDFKIQAKTNKDNFAEDLDICLCSNGDNYIPDNNIARHTYYPNYIANVNTDYSNSITLQQPNISICSTCLHTSLGLFDECPHCGSENISQYNEKKDVTICRNPECEWISDGRYDYCPHCLSIDVEQTKVDFNKTYCYKCNHIANDYYPVCPKCFSTKILHMNNDEKKYQIYNKDSQNIDQIIIKSDTNRVNLCNINVQTDMIKASSQTLKYLNLHLYGNNHNLHKFYYCESCHQIGIGDATKCSYCNSENITKNYEKFNNTIIDIYLQVDDYVTKIKTCKIEDVFDIPIDILSIATQVQQTNFKLLLYAENKAYDITNQYIETLDTDDYSYDLFVDNIPMMDLTLDNIYYDYKYINESEWNGIDNLHHLDHTGVKYIFNKDNESNYIKFSNFNMKNEKIKHCYLNINGINKADTHVKMQIMITDKNNKYLSNISYDDEGEEHIIGDNIINPNLFNYQIDLFDFDTEYDLQDPIIHLKFYDAAHNSEIILTNISLTTEKEQIKNIPYTNINKNKYDITKEDDTYLIHTNNIFGLTNEIPYYLDGKKLKTNLACFLNLGTLHNQEYIRLYNVQMLITYKNKYGKMITEHVNIIDMDNEDEESISPQNHTKYMANALIQKNNAEVYGTIQTPTNIINNLEYQIFNNDNEESLQATPLYYELLQSFTINDNNIGRIRLNYDGSIGYPNDVITVQIFDDYQNTPNNLLYSNNFVMPELRDEISIDVNLDDLAFGQYWFKLIDHTANKNNYHRFKHNDNINVGNLIINTNAQSTIKDDEKVLSFAIDNNSNIRQYYNTPVTLDLNNITDFKTCYTFYRYNTKSTNNAYVQNIKNQIGYLYYDESKEDEIIEDEQTIEDDINGFGYEDEDPTSDGDS